MNVSDTVDGVEASEEEENEGKRRGVGSILENETA